MGTNQIYQIMGRRKSTPKKELPKVQNVMSDRISKIVMYNKCIK